MERLLPAQFPAGWHVPAELKEAMLYSLMAGGKRLRPLCVIIACESLGGPLEAADPVACAIEMLHTYSLVHDDLPAMDNDDYRRGKPTNHKVFGEALAILAGDALLTHAFYTVAQSARRHSIPAEIALTITEELSVYAGMRGMVGGQTADILGEQGMTTLVQLEYIHLHKTSDLIVFALRAGAHLAGANGSQLNALTEFGTKLGLAFQIQDDILDITGEEVLLGKPTGSDEKCGKVTYPYFIGLEASKQEVVRLTEEAKQAVRQAGFPFPARLYELADFLLKRQF
ncbi:polyprenyl synthetase family protein [Paenibacillus popilliae]|uniref:Farnesyl diphosphate synthase n=1 Tax=Paenibacillus popilliae ATCC 14706 TaxID=1212764 RepID=M9LIP2_PAEPP|nr:farnesyl diphosphate synthase [Paenibacillus popilliae]GAC43025.1 geranylgeranyl pyrophosphate synthase [Paenibacillus popilliae ATCC 14706]